MTEIGPQHEPAPTPCGLLIIDKPIGPTSMDVCRRIRWRLVQAGAPKRVKVGHGGTLDPLATGLLVVMVGKATRLCEQVMVGEKEYRTTVDFSVISSTDDAEGERTAVTRQGEPPTREELVAACARWTGTVMQRPPIYSAIKVQGREAYKLARAGEADDLKLAPRPVRIDAIEVAEYSWPTAELVVRCGKGTYIRSLARDIGAEMGVGGMLLALRRTRVGAFEISQSRPLGSLPERLTQADLLPLDGAGGINVAGGP